MEAKSLTAIAAFALVTFGNSALAEHFEPIETQSTASVTENIDPCQVIPAVDVEAELGTPVVGKADLVRALRQGQPTQITQASCVYRPTSRDSVQLTLRMMPHNNPQQYLTARQDRQERLSRRPGAVEPQGHLVPLPSIGEGAYADIPPEGGPATLEVAVRRWVVTITLSASGKGSTLETLQRLARVAVARLAFPQRTWMEPHPGRNARASGRLWRVRTVR
jgi:hypothetical protein